MIWIDREVREAIDENSAICISYEIIYTRCMNEILVEASEPHRRSFHEALINQEINLLFN